MRLGTKKILTIDDINRIARGGERVLFTRAYRERASQSRAQVERFLEENRPVYGVTTGFGILCDRVIPPEQAALLQRNIVLSHAVSVGEPMPDDEVRAIMAAILQNLGLGFSGVRLSVLELLREFLNKGIVPVVPRDGSVGYLSAEGHIAAAVIGEGFARFRGEALPSREALARAGIEPAVLAAKEGLALINGATSPTALAALGVFDMRRAAKTADVVAALTHEALCGSLKAFDDRAMALKRHGEQRVIAANLRRLLADSEICRAYDGARVQEALSIRGIPQLHGAAREAVNRAADTVERELNSCSDNPAVLPSGEAMSSCNCDAAYVGLAADSVCVAAAMLAKMAERRTARLLDERITGLPWFLASNAGVDSGLMVTQYAQAGLLGELRMLAQPAVADNIPTCGGQEDYVSMGYNAAKKVRPAAEKLEYILAIELLSAYRASGLRTAGPKRASAADAVFAELSKTIPATGGDIYLHPHIERIRGLIHGGEILRIAESAVGSLA